MGKLVLDAATRAKFAGLTERVELVDEAGRPAGFYTPPDRYALKLPLPIQPFTEDELNAPIDPTDEGRLLEDILRDLREGR